jgi:copper chaperone CopZ
MKKLTLQLETLACPTCAHKIETALGTKAGVTKAQVLFNSSKAVVEYDETKESAESLAKVVRDLGYDVLKMK